MNSGGGSAAEAATVKPNDKTNAIAERLIFAAPLIVLLGRLSTPSLNRTH
jgi:hypothetical protein